MEVTLFVIQRSPKYDDELVFLPICGGCHKPITNFNKANICPPEGGESEAPLEPAGIIDDDPLWLQPGKFEAFHWECEPHTYPWKRLADVLQMDQRGIFK